MYINILEKYRQQITVWYMRIAFWRMNGCAHIFTICISHLFFTAILVARLCLIIMLYEDCLSFVYFVLCK